MALISSKIWTYSLVAGSLTIDSTFGLMSVSVVLVGGTGTIRGNCLTINGYPSSALPLTLNVPVTIGTEMSSSVIDYLELTTTGTILILGRQ